MCNSLYITGAVWCKNDTLNRCVCGAIFVCCLLCEIETEMLCVRNPWKVKTESVIILRSATCKSLLRVIFSP